MHTGDAAASASTPAHTSSPLGPLLHRAPRRTISFCAPLPTIERWCAIQDAIGTRVGRPLEPWQSLLVVLEDFLQTWDDPKKIHRPHWHEIHLRDGYRCSAPGCTSRRRLEGHHIVQRNEERCDEPFNVIGTCAGHHRQGVHARWVQCEGRAPDGVEWRYGVRTEHAPREVFRGDIRIGGRGFG
jgi:hypothetical protein